MTEPVAAPVAAPVVAVVPGSPPIEEAVRAGGGRAGAPASADAIVWTDPKDPEGLRAALAGSPARWVQLPFAGIESFVRAGVVDPGRTWTCAKGIYGHATAEHALALMAAAARTLPRFVRERRWLRAAPEHRRLAGTTALIAGTGGIGRALAAMLQPLEVRIVAVNRSGAPLLGAERTVPSSQFLDVVSGADWVVLAAAHTNETHHLVGAEALSRMKPSAWVVNVARGGLVDTEALVAALRAGAIGGAALDVTDPEPLPDDHALWSFDNVIVTSHTANTVAMALPELAAMVERNVRRFARGDPLEGLVDPALGY